MLVTASHSFSCQAFVGKLELTRVELLIGLNFNGAPRLAPKYYTWVEVTNIGKYSS